MNQLVLKTLLMSIITEIKFGQPLARNAGAVKRDFKKSVGLKPSATNEAVIGEIGRVYKENNLAENFKECMTKFSMQHLIPEGF